jgi:hypothetical protein
MTALGDTATTTEEETRTKGKTHRKSATRHLPSVLEQLRRYETLASNLRSKLGLDPVSAARVGRDLATSRYLEGATPLNAALEQIEAKRRGALTTGGNGA